MVKIIVSATNKGEEGKTTISTNLAEYFSIVTGKRVLGIDLNPSQSNFSNRYLKLINDPVQKGGKRLPNHPFYDSNEALTEQKEHSIADVFSEIKTLAYPTMFVGLEIIPSYPGLGYLEKNCDEEEVRSIYDPLCRFLLSNEIQNSYDVVIIDTPPSLGNLTTAAIRVATHMIMPVQMKEYSIGGVYGMFQLLKQEIMYRNENVPVKLAGILANQFRNIDAHKSSYDELINSPMSEYAIPYVMKLRDAYEDILRGGDKSRSIFKLSKSNAARKECEAICSYIKEKVFE